MSRYKVFRKYKDSGVPYLGKVPAHWELKRLKHLADFNPAPPWSWLETHRQDYPFFPMEAIGETGALDSSRRKTLEETRTGYTYFANGDVAYAKVTPCFENGKGSVFRNLDGEAGFGTSELTVLRPHSISAEYLYSVTSSYQFRELGTSEMTGAGGLKRVPDEFAKNFCVAVPPDTEQKQIITGLEKAIGYIDALITKKTHFVELLREKRLALIANAVTKGINPNVNTKDSGVKWMGRIPSHWGVVQSRRLFSERKQKAIPGEAQLTSSQKHGVIPQDLFMELEGRRVMVVAKGYDILKHIEPGDFLISMRSFEGGLEECTLAGCVSSAYVPLTPIKWVWNGFFRYLLKSTTYIQALQSTSDLVRDGQALRFENFCDVPLPVVPIEEQQAIAEFLAKATSKIDALIEKTSKSVSLLSERRSALITAAVTGQIDLREAI